jgi:hypothetical protein
VVNPHNIPAINSFPVYIMKSKFTILALFSSAALLQANDTDLAKKPANGPEWGLRFGLTFLFPN